MPCKVGGMSFLEILRNFPIGQIYEIQHDPLLTIWMT